MKQPKEKLVRGLVAAAALGLIGVMAVMNLSLVLKPARSFLRRRASFRKTVSTIAKNYSSDELWLKNNCVTLNGAFARLTGRRVYNEVTLMNNGMLTNESSPNGNRSSDAAIKKTLERYGDLSAFLDQRGIPFLFILAPSKLPLTGDLLPAGANIDTNENIDRLLADMASLGIDSLDLRPLLAKDAADVEKYFYRTDHHWNTDASVASLMPIMEGVEAKLGTALDKSFADPDMWERHSKEDWSLGSLGKRVGPWYAGVDPLIWYTPRYDAQVSYVVPSGAWMKKGAFAESCMEEKRITAKDYYGISNYPIYGKNYALAMFRNADAPNDKRVLLIHDSFGTSTMAFLSTMFTEVDAIDPRNYKDSTVAQYVEWTRPDIVLMLCNPSGVKPCAVRYGGADCLARAGEAEVEEMLAVDAAEDEPRGDAWMSAFPFECAPGDTCHLRIEDAGALQGDAAFVVAEIYDAAGKEKVASTAFDIDYCRARDGFSWDFIAASTTGSLELRLFACGNDKKRGAGARYAGIRLTRDIPANPAGAG